MAVIDGSKRSASVRAAIKSEVIRFPGEAFNALLDAKPDIRDRALTDMAARREINDFVESRKASFGGAVDMYSQTAQFLVDNGLGEATDVLLIDEKLCVGCDNCEKACADSHDGLSRLDREAGRTYAHLHVPTSCRHCEHPHCMADCPPNAIQRGPDGEVVIDETCIGCGNCQRNCPYGVIRMDAKPPAKPGLLNWLLFGAGPGPAKPATPGGRKGCRIGRNRQAGDQMRHVQRDRRRPRLRSRVPDRCSDPGQPRTLPQRGTARGRGRLMATLSPAIAMQAMPRSNSAAPQAMRAFSPIVPTSGRGWPSS